VQTAPTFWLGRQPILDRKYATVAFELLFRSGGNNSATVVDNRMATASVISHAFSELGIASVLGDCRDLRRRGFSFALDDIVQLDAVHSPLLPFVEIIKIDVLGTTPDSLERLVRKARAATALS